MKERSFEEATEIANQAKVGALKEVLPITDNYFRAKSVFEPLQTDGEKFVAQTYDDVFTAFSKVIEDFGVTRVLSVGQSFDFNFMEAIIKTNKGQMKVTFFETDAPKTVANFVKLAKDGYYNGLIWHRVLPNFVIQGGCPKGDGTGGPGYKIDCELKGDNQYHDRGVLSMAHAGRNTGGSQFFVCHSRQQTSHLDRNHTCFGKVIEGLDVIDAIREGDSIDSIELI
jgi:peptidyl-prolyl cis-trans isomerase B (cyclophilin B)